MHIEKTLHIFKVFIYLWATKLEVNFLPFLFSSLQITLTILLTSGTPKVPPNTCYLVNDFKCDLISEPPGLLAKSAPQVLPLEIPLQYI